MLSELPGRLRTETGEQLEHVALDAANEIERLLDKLDQHQAWEKEFVAEIKRLKSRDNDCVTGDPTI